MPRIIICIVSIHIRNIGNKFVWHILPDLKIRDIIPVFGILDFILLIVLLNFFDYRRII